MTDNGVRVLCPTCKELMHYVMPSLVLAQSLMEKGFALEEHMRWACSSASCSGTRTQEEVSGDLPLLTGLYAHVVLSPLQSPVQDNALLRFLACRDTKKGLHSTLKALPKECPLIATDIACSELALNPQELVTRFMDPVYRTFNIERAALAIRVYRLMTKEAFWLTYYLSDIQPLLRVVSCFAERSL